ncbi:LOW QUALITY PROTEIN: receptor-type tyrosine-protein phosphatase S-like [Atheta coriaria]|uniref:LOW QUALITY PROTEIN: receptor-type tyrosine-protein phosphatase S-like n=1 Tax=Dalotia coriaria TaxID=877792 RepID=UPI0031F38AC3
MWALFLLIFVSQGFYQVLGKTQLLFANVTGTGRNARVEAECFNDNYNDAIAWITSPQNNNILAMLDNDLSSIDFNWDKAGWASDFAYKGMFGPIMDYSWETFPIIKTHGAEPRKNKYNFEKLDPIKIFNQFELNFSFLGKSNAQIYMCTGTQVQKSACFTFILGGWEGKGSILRRCKNGTSPIISTDKLDGCENVVEKKVHGSLFSEDNWSHISIRYSNKQLLVIVDDNSLMLYIAANNCEFNQYSRLFIHSYNETALWKYHNYLYQEARNIQNGYIDSNWFHVSSGQLFISFFANFEKETTISLYGYSDNDIPKQIKTFNYEGDKNLQWNYKTFNSSEVENNTYILRIYVDEENIIAIRNVIYHVNCRINKRNHFHSSILSFDGLPYKTKCTSLREKSAQLALRQASNRSDTEKQNSLCTTFYNNTVCKHRIICNEKFCYCSMGFNGIYCESACNPGTYGFNCESKCGECKYSTNCNTISGECPNGCKDNYIGPNCKQRDLPVLNDIAGIQTECISDCAITIFDNNLNYDGVQQPKYYYTQLTHPNRIRTEGEVTSIKSHIIKFTNLLKDHKYTYQIVLCVNNNKRECYGKNIKTFEFETKCEEISQDQIIIKSVPVLTTVTVTDYNSEIQCDLSQYRWSLIETSRNKEIRSGSLDVNIYCNALNLFTNYSLQLTRNNRITNNISFTTDESIPNAVKNIKRESKSSNTLTLIWDEPFPVVGIITNYLVEWKFMDKRDCSIDNKSQDIQSRNVTEPRIKLCNLQFYSEYHISIYAFTKKGRGHLANIIGQTEAKDGIELKAYKYNVYPAENAVTISLVIDCINWNGPVSLYITATCKSEWCDGKVTNGSKLIKYNDMNATVQNLHPYTNYYIEMYLFFDSKNDHLKLRSADVMTRACAPNPVQFAEVYSSTENTLSIRWSAPYPPTGVLDTFLIEYEYKHWIGWRSSKEAQFNSIRPCKIWTNMYCTTLYNLDRHFKYDISIYARNKNVSGEGQPIEFSGYTSISAPQPPLNLQAIWNESHFLHLQWQHPNKTNGPFVRFDVNIRGQRFKHQVSENFTYTVKTYFQCKPKNHHAAVSVQTINSKFESSPLSNTFSCPVFKAAFKSEPETRDIDNNTLSIYIPSIENAELNSNLYIILITRVYSNERNCKTGKGFKLDAVIPIQDYKSCQIIGHYEQVQYKVIEETETHVTFKEAPDYNFKTETYELNILIVNEFNGQMSHTLYQVARDNDNGRSNTAGFNFWWLILSVAIVIIITGGLVWKRVSECTTEKKLGEPEYSEIPIIDKPPTRASSPVLPPPLPMREIQSTPEKNKKFSKVVPVSDIDDHIRTMIFDDELLNQHKKILELPENINGYLQPKTAPDSIAANYISSPLCSNAYIMCLAPTSDNVYQFWRMIVAESVKYIILFATPIDLKKKNLFQYWPDYPENKTISFQDIEISTQSVEVKYTYKVYNMKATRGTHTTLLRILHFTNWSKRGIPMNPNHLTSFLQCLETIPHSSKYPILVHDVGGYANCASVIILVDICLRQAELDGQVDIFHHFQLLHSQRPNIMDNVEDYFLVHLILVKYLATPHYAYPCNTFSAHFRNLNDAALSEQMKMITDSMWQESVLRLEGSVLFYNKKTRRDQDIIPHPSCCVFLRPLYEKESCYINAIFVDGYQQSKQFIVTQHPLTNTVDDFWRMIVDNNVKLVISLQPEYDVEFWNNGGDFQTPNGTSIEHLKIVKLPDLHMHTLFVKPNGTPIKKIETNLIEVVGWKVEQAVPVDLRVLLSTRLQMKRTKCEEFSSVVVMCRNGASACGLYIAACNLLDSMESEQVVDVCTSVRNIRNHRSQFVTDQSQFHALYKVASIFLDDFRKYSNLKTSISAFRRNTTNKNLRKKTTI